MESCYISSSSAPWWIMRAPPPGRSVARTHVGRLQVLKSKCLRLATGAPWYVSKRHIHEDLGVPLFAGHIRALTASFDSRLADKGIPLVRQLGRYLRWPRVAPVARSESQRRQGTAGQPRPSPAMAKSAKRNALGAHQPSAFRLTWLWFSVIFLSCKGKTRVYDAKSGHGPQTPHPGAAASPKRLKKSRTFSLRLSRSGLRTQAANQPKSIPPQNSPGLPTP
jgi:hypothetical protein